MSRRTDREFGKLVCQGTGLRTADEGNQCARHVISALTDRLSWRSAHDLADLLPPHIADDVRVAIATGVGGTRFASYHSLITTITKELRVDQSESERRTIAVVLALRKTILIPHLERIFSDVPVSVAEKLGLPIASRRVEVQAAVQPAPQTAVSVSDERYKFVYEATKDLMSGQRSVLDNLRQRATTLISATTVTTTFATGIGFLGTGTRPLPTWVLYVSLALVVVVGFCAFRILLPTTWVFALGASKLIDAYVEAKAPSSLDDMYRDVSLHLEKEFDKNEQKLEPLFWDFRIGVAALTLEVVVVLIGLIVR